MTEEISEEKKKSLSIAILGYKVPLLPPWDPEMTKTGLPGSEECAVYATEELARRGHKVTLYMNPPETSKHSLPSSNPLWLSIDEWDKIVDTESKKYDLVLMWRRGDVDAGRKHGKKVFFWAHDSPGPVPPNGTFPNFDGITILSKHHHQQWSAFPGFSSIPYLVCGNGIVPEQFRGTDTQFPNQSSNPFSIGYFSNYSRGLLYLVMFWPEIRKEFPEATLAVCYGRETWNTMSPQMLKYVCDRLEEYKPLGVTEHGKVGHLELAKIMKNTSVWAYPCNTEAETFCITATKCQAAGMIPVTTRIGALLETVHPEAPSMLPIANNADVHKYKDLLLTTLRRVRDSPKTELKTERQKYVNFALEFSWENCVKKWLELYEMVSK